MEDKRKRLLRYLNDSYAAEVGGLMALKDLAMMAGAANEPQLRSAVEDHIRVTQFQADRLRDRILALGGDKSEPKAFVNSAIAKGSSVVNMFHDKEDKLTQDLIKAYSFEHFEIGAYIALRTYSESIGDTETALLATQIMDEERMAAEQLERFIPACSQKAIYRTSEFNPSYREHESESKGGFLGIPPAAFLIPGAVLAVWGVSKWLEGRDKGENDFRTATTYNNDYEYAGASVATPDVAMAGTSSSTTVYSSENAYVPSSLEDETGSSLSSGTTVVGGSTFGSSSVSGTHVDDFRVADNRPAADSNRASDI
jgi:ferritin-like metal-binding protein YciE